MGQQEAAGRVNFRSRNVEERVDFRVLNAWSIAPN
jgi:hypothetical protein